MFIIEKVCYNILVNPLINLNTYYHGGMNCIFKDFFFYNYLQLCKFFLRPSGNLISSSRRLPDKHEIIFFEKNGLRHGEFSLRETQTHKVEIILIFK